MLTQRDGVPGILNAYGYICQGAPLGNMNRVIASADVNGHIFQLGEILHDYPVVVPADVDMAAPQQRTPDPHLIPGALFLGTQAAGKVPDSAGQSQESPVFRNKCLLVHTHQFFQPASSSRM